MNMTSQTAGRRAVRDHRFERIMVRLLFVICFPLCLTAALFVRLGKLFAAGETAPQSNVFSEARSAAFAAIGYAYCV